MEFVASNPGLIPKHVLARIERPMRDHQDRERGISPREAMTTQARPILSVVRGANGRILGCWNWFILGRFYAATFEVPIGEQAAELASRRALGDLYTFVREKVCAAIPDMTPQRDGDRPVAAKEE
jgi:hypothetical protein